MIPNELVEYLQDHLLLKSEELNLNDAKEHNGIVDISVIKRTSRTRRIVARLTVGSSTEIPELDKVPNKLLKAFKSPHSKKLFNLSDETFAWIRAGFVIREFRLENDERTVKNEQYRMGAVLFQLQKLVQTQKNNQTRELIVNWRTRWLESKHIEIMQKNQRQELIKLLEQELDKFENETQYFLDGKTDIIVGLNTSWRLPKQVLFLHFLVALYLMAITQKHYDWKQIGANYYRKIGGSKEFDFYKKEFIEETERLLQRPIQLFGLATLGTITPIVFTGPMQGENVTYEYGSVHATTDLAIFTNTFKTDSEVLWVVENRGILTRIAYEEKFLQETKSFVLGIDGQVRSAHRELLVQLAKCVKQVIIWTDVDEAGLTIAKEVFKATESKNVVSKCVVPPLDIVTELEVFEDRYQQLINNRKEEQEQEVGGVELWKKWITQ